MDKLNEHIEFLEMTESDPQLLVWLLELRRHRQDQDNWKQRAEAAEEKQCQDPECHTDFMPVYKEMVARGTRADAAEAKLAELSNQKAAGFVNAPRKAKLFYHGEGLPVDTKLFTRPAPAAVPTKDQIREVFMRHGFTVKEGQSDLKPYVYDAAYALFGTSPVPAAVPVDLVPDDTKRMDWLESKVVNVREHLPYGSDNIFWSQQTTDDCDENYASDLREQIDKMLRRIEDNKK